MVFKMFEKTTLTTQKKLCFSKKQDFSNPDRSLQSSIV